MSEQNKAIFRRFVEDVVNRQNVAALDGLIGPSWLDHNPPPGGDPGLEGMKQMMGMFFSAFPDLHSNIYMLAAEGDVVAGRMTTTGTHQGDFMGIAATGKQVSFTETHLVRIANGKAVEHWGNSDDLAMMQQLGVVPTE